MRYFYNKKLKPVARQLRKSTTQYEKILWSKLRKRQVYNVQFYRQVPIGSFIVDFYSRKLMLVIEVDGGYHLTTDMVDKDLNRDTYFNDMGIPVLRFTNKQIATDMQNVMIKICNTVKKLLSIKKKPPSDSKEVGAKRRVDAHA